MTYYIGAALFVYCRFKKGDIMSTRQWVSRVAHTIAFTAAGVALLCLPAAAQQGTDYSKLQIKTNNLGHGVYLLGWQGGDSLVLVTSDGVLLVDTAVPQLADKIKAAIAQISSKPLRYVIITHAHADHFGGNEVMAKAGAILVAHDNVRSRMEKGQYLAAFNQTIPPSLPAAIPTLTYSNSMTIHAGAETIELIHVPHAHTDSDSLVFFRKANVIHTSGTFGNDQTYTFFDMSSDGSLSGTIAAQEKVLALANGRTKIIADEGEPSTKAALRASHDSLVEVRARVQKLIDAGESEEQVIAAKPTQDLDLKWVHPGGFLTGDVFTRMAYESLKGIKPPTTPKAK
jgi:glyoxylase-like metal-dependent hydrolase (beta-lactamase superfamily II)